MRVVVTGAGNPYGNAIARALLQRGDMVRLFAVGPEVAQGLEDAVAEGAVLQWHAGDIDTLGSIEPVLSEREVLVHAACLDPPGRNKVAHAVMIERGTLGCKYGAERELVDQFIHVAPVPSSRDRFRKAQERARQVVESCRKVQTAIVEATDDPEETAQRVVEVIAKGVHPGRYPGRETDAVAA